MSHIGSRQQAIRCSRDTNSTKSSTACCCNTFFKLVRKLVKIRGVRLLGMGSGKSCKQKCKYDPLSYSLNFDSNGCGRNLSDDEDYYYRFYAFSSRFVATSTTSTSCPRLVGATSQY